jgi:hypothetical protein
MACYIFLKSLRSLEEFRKNLHVKIPPKSPSTNFQSLDKFKIQFLFRKEFFVRFRPNRPSGQPARLASQPSPPPALPLFSRRPRARPIPSYTALAYWPKYVSPSCLRSPVTTPHVGRPWPCRRFSRPPRTTPPLPRDAESRS